MTPAFKTVAGAVTASADWHFNKVLRDPSERNTLIIWNNECLVDEGVPQHWIDWGIATLRYFGLRTNVASKIIVKGTTSCQWGRVRRWLARQGECSE